MDQMSTKHDNMSNWALADLVTSKDSLNEKIITFLEELYNSKYSHRLPFIKELSFVFIQGFGRSCNKLSDQSPFHLAS